MAIKNHTFEGRTHSFIDRKVDGNLIIKQNLIIPYKFENLPIDQYGNVQWSEFAPTNWVQYGPYRSVFNKVYLRKDESLETIPNGGGNEHIVKLFGVGSKLGLFPVSNLSVDQYNDDIPINNWSLPRIFYAVNIPVNKTYVHFGCFYKIPANDRLRPLNLASVNIVLSSYGYSSYINHYTICGESVPTLVGGTDDYYAIYGYQESPPRVYDPYKQWNGNSVKKIRNLGQKIQDSSTNDWQLLNFKIEIPNENHPNFKKPSDVTFFLGFGENLTYLDDNSGFNTGSIYFYNPFLYFT